MRHVVRFLALAPLALAPLALSGCKDAAGPLVADIAYQLTCAGTSAVNCMPAMLNTSKWDYVERNGREVVGPSGNSLGELGARCSASEVSPGVLSFSMRAEVGDEYIQIEGLRLNSADGSFAGGPCRVSVSDGSVLYGGSSLGACSAAAPTAGTPCQVVSSTIDRDADEGPLVDLRLSCAMLPNSNEPSSQASLRDAQALANPAIIAFSNCSGL